MPYNGISTWLQGSPLVLGRLEPFNPHGLRDFCAYNSHCEVAFLFHCCLLSYHSPETGSHWLSFHLLVLQCIWMDNWNITASINNLITFITINVPRGYKTGAWTNQELQERGPHPVTEKKQSQMRSGRGTEGGTTNTEAQLGNKQ